MTADQARMLYEKTLKQEREFAQSFTGQCGLYSQLLGFVLC